VKCGHGWPKLGNKTCASCIANVNAYKLLRDAVNAATRPYTCEHPRANKTAPCPTCAFKATFQAIRLRLRARAGRAAR
jgi:hypothetical protein